MADKKKRKGSTKAVAPRQTAEGFGFVPNGTSALQGTGATGGGGSTPSPYGINGGYMANNVPPSSDPTQPLGITYGGKFSEYNPGMTVAPTDPNQQGSVIPPLSFGTGIPLGPGTPPPDIYNMPVSGGDQNLPPSSIGQGSMQALSTDPYAGPVPPGSQLGATVPSGSYANDLVLGGVVPGAAFGLMGNDNAYYDQYANATGMDLYSGNYAMGMQNADALGTQYLMGNPQGIDPLGQSQFNQGQIQNNATPGGTFYTAQDFQQQAFSQGSAMFNHIFGMEFDQYGNPQPKSSEQQLSNYLGALEQVTGGAMGQEQASALASHYGMILRDYKIMENAGQASMPFYEYLMMRTGMQQP